MALLQDLTVFGVTNLISDTFANNIFANGFHHNAHNNNDSVLLAGGGHKPIADFLPSTTIVNYVSQENSTTANWRGVILGYNSNASANTGISSTVSNVVYTTNNLTVQPSTGALSSKGRGTFVGVTSSSGFTSTSGDLIFNNVNHILWNSGSYHQRIFLTDDNTSGTAVFTFQQSANTGSTWTDLFTIKDNGTLLAGTNTVYHSGNYASHLYIGAANAAANATASNPYLKLYNTLDSTDTLKEQYQLSGSNDIKVNSDATGNITFSNKGRTVYFIVGTSTTNGTWLGSHPDITEYYDGLTVLYYINKAGASTTTLNINDLGAITCYYGGTTKLTTHYAVGSIVLLTYYNNGWRRCEYYYDSDTNTKLRTYIQITDDPTWNQHYPIIASRTLASGFEHVNGKYVDVYGLIGANGLTPTFNPITGAFREGFHTVANGSSAHAEGSNTTANSDYSHAEGYGNTTSGNYSHAEGSNNISEDLCSHTEGYGTRVHGNASHTEGYHTKTFAQYAHAEGSKTIAGAESSHAEGHQSVTRAWSAHAEGYHTQANGEAAHAEGWITRAFGDYSHAEGHKTHVKGRAAHGEGYGGITFGDFSHTEGYWTKTGDNGVSAHAEGQYTKAMARTAHAEGFYTIASGESSHAEGSHTKALGDWSHSEGSNSIAEGDWSHSEGNYTRVYGVGAHAEGVKTMGYGLSSHAEGGTAIYFLNKDLKLSGNANDTQYSLSLVNESGSVITQSYIYSKTNIVPYDVISLYPNGHKITYIINCSESNSNSFTVSSTLNTSNFSNSQLRIYKNVAFGDYSHVEGYNCNAIGSYSHAEGQETRSVGDYSHAEGLGENYHLNLELYGDILYHLPSGELVEWFDGESNNILNISGPDYGINPIQIIRYSGLNYVLMSFPYNSGLSYGMASHVEGNRCQAIGIGSHAEGTHTKSYGSNSHAEGLYSIAVGGGSHAEGVGTVSYYMAHSEGYNTRALGIYSHTSGQYTISKHLGEFACGYCNLSTSHEKNHNYTLFTIGNGTSSTRQNAVTVWSTGDMDVLGNISNSSDISRKHDIQDLGDDAITNLFATENGFIREFTWNESNKVSYGFIAQEIENYCPEAVSYDASGLKVVNYNAAFAKIIGSMYKKIKELEIEIDILKNGNL